MQRRFLSLVTIAVLILTACTTRREFNSDRISLVTRGSGPDVILIPGLTGQREEVWASVADTLDDRYRLHLVQVNGFGGVEPGANAEGPVSAPVAEEVARYIREASLDRPAVIGHSMGGTIGMMLAARHPDVLGRLMVVDMMPYLRRRSDRREQRRRDSAVSPMRRAHGFSRPAGTGFIAEMFQGMTLNAERQAVLMRHARESDRRTVAHAFYELIVTDLRLELSRITAPVTVLYVHPPNVPIPPQQFDASMSRLYADAPKARLVRIHDRRHFIHWDQPMRFTAEVDAFMKRTD